MNDANSLGGEIERAGAVTPGKAEITISIKWGETEGSIGKTGARGTSNQAIQDKIRGNLVGLFAGRASCGVLRSPGVQGGNTGKHDGGAIREFGDEREFAVKSLQGRTQAKEKGLGVTWLCHGNTSDAVLDEIERWDDKLGSMRSAIHIEVSLLAQVVRALKTSYPAG